MTLTGLQRFQLVKLWLKRGRPGDKEDYIKKVCELKGITYKEPNKENKDVRLSR